VTLDLAGSGGVLPHLTEFPVSLRDENLRLLRSMITTSVSGIPELGGLSPNSWIVFGPELGGISGIFPEYDGSRDVLSAVLTMTGAMTWGENGIGPRMIRWNSLFSQTSDLMVLVPTVAERTLYVDTSGSALFPTVNSGSYDARSVSAIFSPGGIIAGWTSTPPTQGKQITPAKAQSARVAAYSATQNDGGLLTLGATDPIGFGLTSTVGGRIATVTQSAAGLTFALGASSMTVRYVHFFHQKGQG
jgi:hypothetical protein